MTAFRVRLSFLGAALFISANAMAGSLSAPFSMQSASVLPEGVRSLQFGGFTTEVGDSFDGSGTIVPLANDFNKAVTWRELVDAQPAGFERGHLKGGLQSMGVNLDDIVGDSSGMVNARLTATVPSFAYGITDKMTLGVGVPVIHSNLSIATGWRANDRFRTQLKTMMGEKGLNNKILTFEEQLQNVIATKLSSLGYKPLVNEQRTEIGDLNVGLKYQAAKGEKWAVAVQPRVVVPTGRIADVDKVVDVASGDGQWDVGVSGVGDYHFTSRATATASLSYLHQFESMKTKRVPQSAAESLSADIDPSVREKLGDIVGTSAGFRYRVQRLWVASTAYSFQYKAPDSYDGGRYDSSRYDLLETDSEQTMQTAQLGLTFTTLPLFEAKKFDIPLEASITFASVLAGKNVDKINLTSFELVSYF